jgi:hypothetical protein
MIAWLIIATVCVAVLAAFAAALRRWDGSDETPRRACRPAAGAILPRPRVAGRARGWGRTIRAWAGTLGDPGHAADAAIAALIPGFRPIPAPIRGDAQERAGVCAPPIHARQPEPVTGLLSPRPPEEGPPAASAPPPGPSRLKVFIEATTPQQMAGEIAATSPWNDATGSFTAYIDAGEPS